MSKETRRDKKRLSRIIKVDFGKEVGISLDELELEFDDLINQLDIQETVVEEEEEDETSNDETVGDEEEEEPDIQGSTMSLNKKAAKIKDILLRGNRKRASSTGATTSHPLAQSGKSPEVNFSASETCSLDLDADVFLSSANNSREGSICSESLCKGKIRTLTWLKKLPMAGGKQDGARGRQTNDHLLIPPVLVDGAVTSNYQYMTPVISAEKEKATTLSRLMRRSPERQEKKKKASTLQEMYNATVGGKCGQVGL